jgi:hypothetical protein
MEKRLIRRKTLIPDPRYTVKATEETTTIYKRPPPDHPSYALIGQITMWWSFIETRLALLCHKLRRLCLFDRLQHGHRERHCARASVSRRRMVAIEFGM